MMVVKELVVHMRNEERLCLLSRFKALFHKRVLCTVGLSQDLDVAKSKPFQIFPHM